jgi:calcineurin-like phosphoesterase
LCGLAVETNDNTGLAKRIAPVRLGPHLQESRAEFWD